MTYISSFAYLQRLFQLNQFLNNKVKNPDSDFGFFVGQEFLDGLGEAHLSQGTAVVFVPL